MTRVTVLLMAGLAACATADGAATPGGDPQGWRFVSGKPPSRAEYAAIVAACRDRATALDACLVDLGLRRAE